MRLITVFEYDDLKRLQPGILVEMWDRILSTGMGKRNFYHEFTESERATIKEYYKIFYRWHLVTGIPQEYRMKISTYQLMERACNFFGNY